MERVLLCFDGKPDYLFEIDDIEDLDKAIEYKNRQLEINAFGMSDFEYILEYLDNNSIWYSYIDLMRCQMVEY